MFFLYKFKLSLCCARSCAAVRNFLRTWLEAFAVKVCSVFEGLFNEMTAQLLAHSGNEAQLWVFLVSPAAA
jgi:hypothetical protein